jgi:hypothetical protein
MEHFLVLVVTFAASLGRVAAVDADVDFVKAEQLFRHAGDKWVPNSAPTGMP